MRIIEIALLENGAHRNQTIDGSYYFSKLPEGWAVIPADMKCENFPFGEVEVAEVNGVMTVIKWTAGEVPTPFAPSASQLREQAYNTEAIISWDNNMITVTQAAQLWQYYAAEGNEKATELQSLIAEAKAVIREKHPD